MVKILIAEDDLMIADMAEEVLLGHGYEVCGIGRTVAEAVALGQFHRPDFALIDLRLADGGLGTEVAAELAALGRVGILYATGNTSTVMLTATNGHACLAKPYHLADLLRSLEIVGELMATGGASPPFPRNFQILPSATAISRPRPGGDDGTIGIDALLRQLSAIARFGNNALHQTDLLTIAADAVRACAVSLDVPFCKVHRYRPAENDLLIEAGHGWQSGVVGRVALHADVRSPAGRAFITGKPTICADLRKKHDFSLPPFYASHRVVSTANVPIMGDGRPYGVLTIDNDRPQQYGQPEIDLLTSFANILAQAAIATARTAVMKNTADRLQALVEEKDRLLDEKAILTAELQHRTRNDMQLVYGMLSKQVGDTTDENGQRRIKAVARRISTMSNAHDLLLSQDLTRSTDRPVLIVEDDAALRQDFAVHLNNERGFMAVTAANLAEADQVLEANEAHFDAIILDVALPDGDGRDYCSKLRQQGHDMPIIMVTGSNEERDVIRGLDAGANDYIAKPFGWNELFARLRGQLRSFEDSEGAVFSIGPYTFQPSKRLLLDSAQNRRIRLTQLEAAVLKFLYRSGPRVVARATLLTAVWGYNSGATTHTLETHMYRLRQKMEANSANPLLLLSEPGGYRLDPNAGGSHQVPRVESGLSRAALI